MRSITRCTGHPNLPGAAPNGLCISRVWLAGAATGGGALGGMVRRMLASITRVKTMEESIMVSVSLRLAVGGLLLTLALLVGWRAPLQAAVPRVAPTPPTAVPTQSFLPTPAPTTLPAPPPTYPRTLLEGL